MDTVWTRQSISLEKLKWSRRAAGALASERRLPNGIAIGGRAPPKPDHGAFRWWVRNGSINPRTNLRAQLCAMLGRTAGFTAQTNVNKVLEPPFAAAHDESGRRRIVMAWDALDRAWQNPPVP